MDKVTSVLAAVAQAFHGMSLDDTGGNLVAAFSGPQDGITPPACVVEPGAFRWSDTGRSDGSALLEVTATFYLPSGTTPVAGFLTNRVLSQVRGHLVAEGRNLGGSCLSYRLESATPSTGQLGGRLIPVVIVQIATWINA